MTKKRRATSKRARARTSTRRVTRQTRSARTILADRRVTSSTSAEPLERLLTVLRDRHQSMTVRFAALQSLGAARFASPAFPSIEGEYLAALRDVANDPDLELRQRVLGILAREKDGFAQKMLLEGLEHPDEALLPPEKALQLLGNDVHADAYPIAREIVRNPPNPTARREALRLLAGDAASAPLFENILRDKNETADIRQVSAAALHALNPDSLQAHARQIVLDPSEGDEMHETSLAALTQFGAPSIAADKTLVQQVDRLRTRASAKVQDSARRFLGKFGGR
jgi:hypothetical protein